MKKMIIDKETGRIKGYAEAKDREQLENTRMQSTKGERENRNIVHFERGQRRKGDEDPFGKRARMKNGKLDLDEHGRIKVADQQ